MIYILSTKNEIYSGRIWYGHFMAICKALTDLNLVHELIYLQDVSSVFLSSDTVVNIGNHQYNSGELLESCGNKLVKCKFIGLIDDYQSPLPTQFRKRVKGILLSNIVEPPLHLKSFEWVKEHRFININQASYDPMDMLPLGEGFIYWGSFRKNRTRYFDKYFHTEAYKVNVSASNRSHDKFSEYYNYRPLDKISVPSDLRKFAFTVYMRDLHQPKQCPANRFYEAISAGLAMFFDEECLMDFGPDVNPWVVSCPKDILKYDLEQVRQQQANLFRKDYHTQLRRELTKILGEII